MGSTETKIPLVGKQDPLPAWHLGAQVRGRAGKASRHFQTQESPGRRESREEVGRGGRMGEDHGAEKKALVAGAPGASAAFCDQQGSVSGSCATAQGPAHGDAGSRRYPETVQRPHGRENRLVFLLSLSEVQERPMQAGARTPVTVL